MLKQAGEPLYFLADDTLVTIQPEPITKALFLVADNARGKQINARMDSQEIDTTEKPERQKPGVDKAAPPPNLFPKTPPFLLKNIFRLY